MKKITNLEINNRKILLLDYNYDTDPEFSKIFEDSSFIKLKQEELEFRLAEMVKSRSFDQETTLFVCVGQSSLELYRRLLGKLNFNIPKASYAYAQRVYEEVILSNGKKSYNVKATVGQIQTNECLKLNSWAHKFLEPEKRYNFKSIDIKKVVVFDDVISTGITLKTLFERNSMFFPKASWEAFALVSRLEKVKNYALVSTPCLVENKFTPINTFSKLVEDKALASKYISKHLLDQKTQRAAKKTLNHFYQKCFFTPHVFCFDLYNTLAVEKSDKSYIDYFVEQYGRKHNFTKEDVYLFVRDNLMNRYFETFGEMTLEIFHRFVPDEKCFPYDFGTTAKDFRTYWEEGSKSVEWKDHGVVTKIEKLQKLGHVVALITNCTWPAWRFAEVRLEMHVPQCLSSIWFDSAYVSSRIGFAKPDEEVWKKVEKNFSLFPRNKFVMIGDSFEDDLKVPEKRGWKTVSAEKLCFDESDTIFT